MWIMGLKGLTQYKTIEQEVVAEQAKCESRLPKRQAAIEAFLSPGLSLLTSDRMQEKFLTQNNFAFDEYTV